MTKEEDSSNKHKYKTSFSQVLLALLAGLMSVGLLLSVQDSEIFNESSKTLRSNDYVDIELPTFGFIIEDIEETKLEKLQTLALYNRELWNIVTYQQLEEQIVQKCAQFGCDPSVLIRVMSCESRGNIYATNGRYKGLFQHDAYYWPGRAIKYGVGGADIYDPYAQIHVSSQMFAQGLAYLWHCK